MTGPGLRTNSTAGKKPQVFFWGEFSVHSLERVLLGHPLAARNPESLRITGCWDCECPLV